MSDAPIEPISFNVYNPQPLVIVISGPSGVGKDTVARLLMGRRSSVHFVVTVTSRQPRDNEVDGLDYHFVPQETFDEMVRTNQFIEHALVYQQSKGIPRFEVVPALQSNKDLIFRVDVQGAARLREVFPSSVLIFLVPANQDEWIKRLKERKTETEDTLKKRVDTARQELTRLGEFDYVVVNADAMQEDAVSTIEAIIDAEHHRVNPRVTMLK
jgi:guanylate kinase